MSRKIRSRSLRLAILAGAILAAGLGCTSSSSDPAKTAKGGSGGQASAGGGSSGGPSGSSAGSSGTQQLPTIGVFAVLLVEANYEGATNPAYTDVIGEVDDGPQPQPTVQTALAAPSDATPGCVVYAEGPASCAGIGGCNATSSNAVCAAAAISGVNPCVCVATDTCQAYPTKVNAGTVTATGIATTTGATQFQMVNVENSYQVGTATQLTNPGFAEGDTLTFSATGGVYGAFEVSAPAIAPMKLTNDPFNMNRVVGSSDPTEYQALTMTWVPPVSTAPPSRVIVDLNISLHAGTVGRLLCDVADNGSLTISGGLLSQLAKLGNIGGYPELEVTRVTYGYVPLGPGKLELEIESEAVRFPNIEGYTSCLRDADCQADQLCNTGNKLCEALE